MSDTKKNTPTLDTTSADPAPRIVVEVASGPNTSGHDDMARSAHAPDPEAAPDVARDEE
jgi:hypothetical protein